jgi:hypothetical protein
MLARSVSESGANEFSLSSCVVTGNSLTVSSDYTKKSDAT